MKTINILSFLVIMYLLIAKAFCQTDNDFFPIYGITLYQTTLKEIEEKGYKCKAFDSTSNVCTVEDLSFWDHNGNGIVEEIYMVNFGKMPEKWMKNFGFDWSLSYSQWIILLKKLNFAIEITKKPKTVRYSHRRTLEAEFIANSKSGITSLTFGFNYGNDEHEGYNIDSRNSLYNITIDCVGVENDIKVK